MVCDGKHHTRLHIFGDPTLCHHAEGGVPSGLSLDKQRTKILGTAFVVLQAADGTSMPVRALLDPGAEESFVSEHVAQTLSLTKQRDDVIISGVGCSTTAIAKYRVSLRLKSHQDANFFIDFSALILPKLTHLAPRRQVSIEDWEPFQGLTFADPNWGTPSRIDCILDAEVYACVIRQGLVKGPPTDRIMAINSALGWLVVGAKEATSSSARHVSSYLAVENLCTVVKRFWEIEEVPSVATLTPDEEACYAYFKSTYTRNAEGRFVVRLPFKDKPEHSDMRGIAEACFHRLERRFIRQPEIADSYRKFMDEYLQLNHMARVPDSQVECSFSSYLPHHAVFKRDDPKKIRVVFNASQKNFKGISLNSLLHTGPKLQEDVLAIILRWSFFPVVFSCDIVKMYRQLGLGLAAHYLASCSQYRHSNF